MLLPKSPIKNNHKKQNLKSPTGKIVALEVIANPYRKRIAHIEFTVDLDQKIAAYIVAISVFNQKVRVHP